MEYKITTRHPVLKHSIKTKTERKKFLFSSHSSEQSGTIEEKIKAIYVLLF